ncbi:rab11 family-interacting protein 3 isoform X2 [Canis lupus dingo]|uniref:rab11 family-interacting protein 3 isoform X2 n=1 Tax=Canis lupus dingo TaxID=286419 RepID=UPI0020C5ABD3|nr:rab11 family-interacting protein 3 isoform X2 [Canis lupus dingo]
MKMEPGRPASPAGGARPDPDPDPEPEPGGPHRPAAAPAPRRTLGAPEPGACADARGAANPGPGPRPPCAAEPDGVCPPPCPDAAPLRGRALGHGPLAGGDVGLFPGFPAPAGGELALDVGPEAPGRPPDFGHPCPLATEPAACPEDGPRLRAVFDALDGDGDGLVRIEDFVQFATVYGADQVKDLTKYLDPGGLGVISFEDFYRGIAAIRNGESDGQLCGVAPAQDEEPPACPDEFDDFVTFEANEVTDSAYMGSESTYSECETFTDEDTSTLVHPELQPECLDTMEDPGHGALLLLPGRSHLHSQSVVTVIGGEEHFEDYGEGSEAELSLETLCSGEHGCRDPAFPTPSPAKRLSSRKVARSPVLPLPAVFHPRWLQGLKPRKGVLSRRPPACAASARAPPACSFETPSENVIFPSQTPALSPHRGVWTHQLWPLQPGWGRDPGASGSGVSVHMRTWRCQHRAGLRTGKHQQDLHGAAARAQRRRPPLGCIRVDLHKHLPSMCLTCCHLPSGSSGRVTPGCGFSAGWSLGLGWAVSCPSSDIRSSCSGQSHRR